MIHHACLLAQYAYDEAPETARSGSAVDDWSSDSWSASWAEVYADWASAWSASAWSASAWSASTTSWAAPSELVWSRGATSDDDGAEAP